jgi:acyl-coenzyme A thioesterase PaaI-like protein
MEEPDLRYFQSIPWCAVLLNDPGFAVTPTFSREPKANAEDSLFAETLKTDNTISRCLSFYRTIAKCEGYISELCTLMALGAGLNGGPGALHGGMITTIMDDCMGTLLTINKDHNSTPLSDLTVTGNLDVRFLQKVPTPGIVVVVAKLKEVIGRKYLLEVEVRDGKGEVLAKANSVWIRKRERL